MRGMLPLSNLVKVSEEEMVLLTGQNDCRAGARAILELGPRRMVTMGEKGAFLVPHDRQRLCATHFVQADCDTTKAEMLFLGALLAYIRGQEGGRGLAGISRQLPGERHFASPMQRGGPTNTTRRGRFLSQCRIGARSKNACSA